MRILNRIKSEHVLFLFFILHGLVAISSAHAVESPGKIWSEISLQTLAVNGAQNRKREEWIHPQKFRSFLLNKPNLEQVLARAPMESPEIDAQSRAQPALIYLPTPDGKYMAFEFVESPVMADKLAEKFPAIKTYFGVSVEDSSITVRFDYTDKGFHAQVLAPGKRWYIDPHFKDDISIYASYYKSDYRQVRQHSQCLLKNDNQSSRTAVLAERSGDVLRTYDLAVATTGEYGVFHGGTVAGTLAAVVTTVNRVTGIYEKELAIRLRLVENNDAIIFTDPNTDPFTGNFSSSVLIDESQTVINSAIGSLNYDIGHTFSTGAGGLANLRVVCDDSMKARGVTGTSQPTGDAFDVDFVAHEIGHQFGGHHTFNGTRGNCSGGNRFGSTAYEPGSGSTIEAYAGICDSDNLQENTDPVFHSETHAEIMSFIAASGSCSSNTVLSNAVPVADAGENYTIPVQTPFLLTGSGTDSNGDILTYLWEQRDLGPQAELSAPDDGQIPLFRVLTPSVDSTRYLPKLATLASNISDNSEKIPQVGRTMSWRLTVRDNNGGVDSDDIQVTVSESAGPFQVLSPNGGETLSGSANVSWNVANTSNAPVNTDNVDIYLSTDSGLTYDIDNPLILNTPNDGSQSVSLPNIDTQQARIMVKGAGNIFFDISDQDFNIAAGKESTPGITSPAPNSTLTSNSETFNWSANGSSVLEWWLYVGSTPGGFDVHDSGSLGASLSTTVSNLPTDGSTVYVRLWYRTSAVWQSIDVQYTAANIGSTPDITSPAPNSTLTSNSETFNWSANGSSVLEWWLYVGSTPGGLDIHDSGSLGTSLSTTVNNLPTDGSTVYVRLWYRTSAGWQSTDIQYTAAPVLVPIMTSPAANSTLAGSSQTFKWAANGASVLEWWLYVGSTQGGFDIHDSGSLGANLSTTVSNLPTDGSTVYVRLWYRTSSGWQSTDIQYTAAPVLVPIMTSPAANSTLTSSSQSFNWTANGTSVLEWWLYVGSTPGGLDIHDSGSLGTSLSTTVNNLPTDGSTVYVRLWYRTSAGWQSTDIQYTAAPVLVPIMTSPAANSTLAGSSQTFKWAANGASVLEWWLYVGSTQGGFDIHDSGSLGANLSTTVSNLPTDGSTVYVRLWYRTSSGWQSTDMQYTAAPALVPIMTSPATNSKLGVSSQNFNWAANGASVLEWWLYAGTTQGGFDIHDSGSLGTSLSTTVNNLPTDGSILYVRLWYRTSAGWQFTDVQYLSSLAFNETETQFVDSNITGDCTGKLLATVNLNDSINSLTVDLTFPGDLDLNVVEPDGNCVWFGSTDFPNGSSFSGDVFNGTETYSITNGPTGIYSIRAHYHDFAQNGDLHISGVNGTINLSPRAASFRSGSSFDENKVWK